MIRENSTVAILVINLKFRNYEKIVFNCYGSAQHDHDICGERGVEHDNAYKMTVNYSRLADALCLSIDQLEAVQDIHSEFCADMMNAGNANADERKPMVEKALQKDLKHMRYVLTENQYRKYLMLLNVTISNRGLEK